MVHFHQTHQGRRTRNRDVQMKHGEECKSQEQLGMCLICLYEGPPLPAHHDGSSNPTRPTTRCLPPPSAVPALYTWGKAVSATETNHLQPNGLNLQSPVWFLGKVLDIFSGTCSS